MGKFLIAVAGVALALVLAGRAVAQPSDVRPVVVSGGDLAAPVTLAPVDADAFQRRLNQPPQFEDETPTATGPSYTVSAAYWDDAVREDEKSAQADLDATYFPDSGLVRVRQDGKDIWIVIDLRQQALLNRYIRLANSAAIGPTPGFLEVLTAAAATEETAVQIGARPLSAEQAKAFWSAVASLRPSGEPPRPDEQGGAAGSAWIIVTLSEGHAVEMVYDYERGTLTDSLGQQSYTAPSDWLRPVIGDYDEGTLAALSGTIAQDEERGSLWWWPLVVGAGLLYVAIAVWADRRIRRRLRAS